jgi:hypothetical protein
MGLNWKSSKLQMTGKYRIWTALLSKFLHWKVSKLMKVSLIIYRLKISQTKDPHMGTILILPHIGEGNFVLEETGVTASTERNDR